MPNPRKVTVADIARAAGVVPSTVSLALKRSPKVAASTVRLVVETAERLGYQPPEPVAAPPVWGLMFPYSFKEYSYTPLDMLLIDTLESAALSNGYTLQSFRLTETGEIPPQIQAIDFARIFVKSDDPAKLSGIKFLHHSGRRNIILFGFEANAELGIQVLSNPFQGVSMLMDAVLDTSCREIAILQPDAQKLVSRLFAQKSSLLKLMAQARNISCRTLCGTPEEMAEAVAATRGNGKTAVIGFRLGAYEEEAKSMDLLVGRGWKPGEDLECFVCEYDTGAMNRPGFYYLDMRGRDIIRTAASFALTPGDFPNGEFMITPKLFKHA